MCRVLSFLFFVISGISATLPSELAPLESLKAIYKGKSSMGMAAVLRLQEFQDALTKIVPAYKAHRVHYYGPDRTPQSCEKALAQMREIEQYYIREMCANKRLINTDQWRNAGLRMAIEGAITSFSGVDDLHQMGLSGNYQNVFFIEHQLDHMSKVLAVMATVAPHVVYFQSEQPDLSSSGTEPQAARIRQNLRTDNVRYIPGDALSMSFRTYGIGVVNFSGLYICNAGRTSFMRTICNHSEVVFIQSMGNGGNPVPEAYVHNLDHLAEIKAGKRHASLVGKDFSHMKKISAFDNLVFAVAIDRDRRIATFSSRPGGEGDYEETSSEVVRAVQNMSVCALGKDVLIHDIDGKDVRCDGTSFAAPIISATASLLRGAFPALSAADIAQAILRSADKYFYIPGGTHGNRGTFMCSKRGQKRQKHYAYEDFDPARYGQGILNAKLAYDFAAMRAHYPRKSLDGVTDMFMEYKQAREMLAAKKIQEAWRGRSGKVSIRVVKLRAEERRKAENSKEAWRARTERRAAAEEVKSRTHAAPVAAKEKEETAKRRIEADAQYSKGRLSEAEMRAAIDFSKRDKENVDAATAVLKQYAQFLDIIAGGKASAKYIRISRRSYDTRYAAQVYFFSEWSKKYKAHHKAYEDKRARIERRAAAEATKQHEEKRARIARRAAAKAKKAREENDRMRQEALRQSKLAAEQQRRERDMPKK